MEGMCKKEGVFDSWIQLLLYKKRFKYKLICVWYN